MRVYVKNMRNEPLMPTTPAKAKKLLKAGKAEIVNRTPFTVRLLYATGETKQDITLGIDAGYAHIGVSASTEGRSTLFLAAGRPAISMSVHWTGGKPITGMSVTKNWYCWKQGKAC